MKWLLAIMLLYFFGCSDTKYYNPDAEKYLASLDSDKTDIIYSGGKYCFPKERLDTYSYRDYFYGDTVTFFEAKYYIDYYQNSESNGLYFPYYEDADMINSYLFYKIRYDDGNEKILMFATLNGSGLPGIDKCSFKFRDEEIIVDDIRLARTLDYKDSRDVGEQINVTIDENLANKLFEDPNVVITFEGNRKYVFTFDDGELLKLYIASLINL